MSDDFSRAFKITIGHEGGWDNNPDDRGNWTSGLVGIGANKGTKYGISAAAYPQLDIRNLTLADAEAIYRRDYWIAAGCAMLPWPVCAVVFDGAVNNGVGRAKEWLRESARAAQIAAKISADGIIGPVTRKALERPEIARVAAGEFIARRMNFMGGLSTWPAFGLGWSRRLVAQATLISLI